MGRKTNLEQKLRKTPLAQGNLMHHYQNWRTWDSQIIDTRERYSNVYRRNCEGLHSILRYWYGERPWHRRWKPPWGFLDDFGSLQEQKARIYLECIQHFSDVDQRTFRRNSECEMFWFLITIMDEINQWWSSNQMGEGVCFATSVQDIEVVRVRAWVLWEARARELGAGQRALHEAEHEERERGVSPLPACSGPPAGSEYRGKSHSQGHKGRQASLGECQMGLARHGLGAEEAVRHCVGEHRTRGTAQQGLEPIQCAEGTSSKSWVSAAGQRAHFGVFGQSSTLSSGISCSWRCVRDSRCHQDIRCSDGIWRCHSVQKCLGWRCLWGLQGHDVGVWEETRVVSGTTVISVQKPTPQTAPPSEPPTQGGRSASRKKNLWGRSPSGKFARQPCRDYFKGFCTKSPCGYDIFLSVNSVNLNRDANSVITAHLHRKVEEQPNGKPKRACDVKSWNHRISTLHRSETKMASMKEPFDDKRKARQQFCHS